MSDHHQLSCRQPSSLSLPALECLFLEGCTRSADFADMTNQLIPQQYGEPSSGWLMRPPARIHRKTVLCRPTSPNPNRMASSLMRTREQCYHSNKLGRPRPSSVATAHAQSTRKSLLIVDLKANSHFHFAEQARLV